MTEIPTTMTPEQAAAARERLVANALVPYVARVFERFDHLRSAAFCVAQFWCDEALDAVHYEWVFSELGTPDVPAGLEDEEVEDPVNLPSGQLDWGANRYPPLLANWDANSSFIPLFAAFCKEDCDQEMDPSESFVPYALFTRGPAGPADVSVQVVGKMLRPWLDGVAPLWDGENDGAEDWDAFVARYTPPPGAVVIDPASEPNGSPSDPSSVPPSSPTPPSEPEPKRRWWQRR
jgi:hypothetical protein